MAIQKVYLLNQTTPVVIPSGLVPKGAYNGATDYAVGDSVDYNGSSYVMFNNAPAGTLPTDTTYWQVMANKGEKGDTGNTGPQGPQGNPGIVQSVNGQSVADVVLNYSDVGAAPALGTDDNYVTDAEKVEWDGKQDHLVYKGSLTDNTEYSPGDVIIYLGRPILVKVAFTSDTSGFISYTKYEPFGGPGPINVWDFGYRPDGTQAKASQNKTAIENAIAVASNSANSGAEVFIPAGYGFINGTIEILPKVNIRGAGMYSTIIQLADGSNCTMFKTHKSSNGGSDPNAYMCGLRDLTLDGRKTYQTVQAPAFVQETNPLTSAASGDFGFDPTNIYENVHIRNANGDGFVFSGRADTRVIACKASYCAGRGFCSTFDMHFVACIAESSGLEGFYIQHGAAIFTNCKSYNSGQVDASRGVGFSTYLSPGGITGAALYAQNNKAEGFRIKDSGRVLLSGITADSNNMEDCGYAGIKIDGSSHCVIDGICFQGLQGGVQVGHQENAIEIVGSSTSNKVVLDHSSVSPATVGDGVKEGSVIDGNEIEINRVFLTPVTLPGIESKGDVNIDNDYSIKSKDSSGSLRKIMTLSSDNVVAVGAQTAPNTNGDLLLFAAGAECARILPGGKVGIGTESPSARLSAKSTGTEDIFDLKKSNNDKAMYVDQYGSSYFLQVRPITDNSYSLGSTVKYWANVYTKKLLLSATGTIEDVSGGIKVTGNLGLYGQTPVARPTTSIVAEAFAANASGIADDSATFGGYTIGQVVAALKNIGILT